MPTMGTPAIESPKPAETPHVARIISSDSIPAGGFTPGTILADRYRIIGLLGRGGMGEVYRADDLKLGQPVALKFLPSKLAEDPVRRERFFAEVRITRQLSHPNICRVYDIAEIDGRHFLSMEFIDGEDLASLLKRIGHLTNEKALDIARQLAAGLAAAHERGVLHRDLKPANIMLDGHGRVRITDFGLAIAVEDESQAAEIAGTPAYMAPEQLAGKGSTVRSDMYSLGLVLYEIYTGRKAFTAATLAELREQKETHTPRAPSEIREGIDPVVERLIRRCMERDPNARPASVAQLALALPGGDPLAAALAAGETPSPEMVAASGSKEGLRPAAAWGLLAFIVAGTLAILAMLDMRSLHRNVPFKKPPEVLIERSREILIKAGYSEEPADSAYGFVSNTAFLSYIEASDNTAKRWENLDSKAVLFWYRQSPRRMEGPLFNSGQPFIGGSISIDSPPLQFPGEMLVMLDTEGRLVSMRVVPDQTKPPVVPPQVPDWTVLFAEAGLDRSKWATATPQGTPLFYADTIAAWRGSLPKWPDVPSRIEASAFDGKPASFELVGPWNLASGPEAIRTDTNDRRVVLGAVLLFVIVIMGGIYFAWRNMRLGRGDRRNATRLAILSMILTMISTTLGVHHSLTPWEVSLLDVAAGMSLFIASLIWVFYSALEPFVRRHWPRILISWTRLLSSEWRDPLVARDVLVGFALGVLWFGLRVLCYTVFPSQINATTISSFLSRGFGITLGIGGFISRLFALPIFVTLLTLALFCLLFIMRNLLRNQMAAILACILFLAVLLSRGNPFEFFWTLLILIPLWFLILMRFGLLAEVAAGVFVTILGNYPITLEASALYSRIGFVALAILAALALYAFRYSLGGRPLLGSSRLDD
jgi:hypothetical protein